MTVVDSTDLESEVTGLAPIISMRVPSAPQAELALVA